MEKKIYSFTNENVSCLNGIYQFDGARVLTVLGSGDQYFTSMLNGAKEVDTFDTNKDAWLYFKIKYYGIMNLTYEEFVSLFVFGHFDWMDIYEKIFKFFDYKTLQFYNLLMLNTDILYISRVRMVFSSYMDGKFIPYLDENTYYRLQEILRKNNKLPSFRCINLVDLCNENPSCDVALLSNIYDWLQFSPYEYYQLVSKIDTPECQVSYCWNALQKEYMAIDEFQVDPVFPPVRTYENFVISLKRKR